MSVNAHKPSSQAHHDPVIDTSRLSTHRAQVYCARGSCDMLVRVLLLLQLRPIVAFAIQGRGNNNNRIRQQPVLSIDTSDLGVAGITNAERSAAALIEAHLVENPRKGLHELMQQLPDVKAFCRESRLRPIVLLSLFPRRFVVELMTTDKQLLSIRLAVADTDDRETAVHVAEADAAAILATTLSNTLWKYHAQRPSSATDPVPISWMARSMPSPMEAWVVATADPSLLFHLDPERSGYSSRACAWAACRNAHFQRFVASHENLFTWHQVGEEGAVALSAAEAARRGDMQEVDVERARQWQQQQRPRQQPTAGPAPGSETASSSSNNLHEALAAAPVGSRALLMRASARTAHLYEEELRAAAEYAELPPHLLAPLAPGLWLQRPCEASKSDASKSDASKSEASKSDASKSDANKSEAGKSDASKSEAGGSVAHARLAAARLALLLPLLAAVRGGGPVLASAPSSAAMIRFLSDSSQHASLRRIAFAGQCEGRRASGDGASGGDASGDGASGGDGVRWSLRVEQCYPPADQRVLPFHPLDATGELSIALSRALGGTYVVSSCSEGAGGVNTEEMAGAVLIGESAHEEVEAGDVAAQAAAPAMAPAAAEAAGDAVVLQGIRAGGGDEADDACCLVLLQAKGGVLLLRDEGFSQPTGPQAVGDLEVGGATQRDASTAALNAAPNAAPNAVLTCVTAAAQLPAWVSAWERRRFFFSSALDPLVALAAVNIAVHTHQRLAGGISGSTTTAESPGVTATAPSALRIVDPCVGSGTTLAAAASRGCVDLLGSDVNADFVARATSNLEAAGLLPASAHLFVHDATSPYPPELLLEGTALAKTVVVSNPPWGNNIGREGDGVDIVRSVTAQFAGATMCFIANGLAVQALRCMPRVTVLRHVPFGSVELVVCVADPQTVESR